jgi:hypothetical protein
MLYLQAKEIEKQQGRLERARAKEQGVTKEHKFWNTQVRNNLLCSLLGIILSRIIIN